MPKVHQMKCGLSWRSGDRVYTGQCGAYKVRVERISGSQGKGSFRCTLRTRGKKLVFKREMRSVTPSRARVSCLDVAVGWSWDKAKKRGMW